MDVNGLGMTPAQADAELRRLEGFFALLPDIPAIYPEWRQLALTVGVSGRQVHDARLAAVMRAHGVTHILTFNPGDFRRYPGITVIHPETVLTPPAEGPNPDTAPRPQSE
jgi:predicted nucleic acid-binding protein